MKTEKENPETALWQKIALMTGSTLFSVALVLGLGSFVKYGDGTLSRAILLKGWQAKIHIFGEPEIGIFEADPVFGWKLKPNSSGRHFQPFGFNVRYHIDDQGHRVTPGTYDLPKILFLGCSFSFGHGVKDDENYIWLLGNEFPHYKLINGSAMAWGTSQAWLQLQEMFRQYDDIELVVYGFINHQQNRNYLRKEWLDLVKSWGRQNPHFEIENGELVYKGLADAGKDAILPGEVLEEKEVGMTLRLVQAMKTFCEERGVPFLVAHIPDGNETGRGLEMRSVLDASQYLDLRETLPYDSIRLKGDAHPSPEGHRKIAGQLAPTIQYLLDNKSVLSADTLNAGQLNHPNDLNDQ